MSAIVTGASGFVGRALIERLHAPHPLSLAGDGWRPRLAAARFEGATVYHLAARVHRAGGDTESEFMRDNMEKTESLARAAAERGARAFVFVSTAKVNGEESGEGAFRASDAPHPEDAYARSKWAAEQALARVASETGLAVSIVRPPLVYGRGVGANLLALVRLCDSPWPLPFGAIHNRRSFIEVSDLAALLAVAAHDKRGGVLTFMASHPQAVSTTALVAALRRALARERRLFALPAARLETMASAVGQGQNMRRLTRSLVVDASDTERALGWRAQVSFEEAVARTVAGYRAQVAR